MEEYEKILAGVDNTSEVRCGSHAQPLARIVRNPDGTERLVATSNADPTSSEFQRFFGPQGSLTTALGVGGVNPGATSPTATFALPIFFTPPLPSVDLSCFSVLPTGTTGCNPDPYFHFPDLDHDSGDCLYIPTFNDVPVTLSMAVYFAQAFLKEVSFDKVLDEIDSDIKEVINKVVDGNLVFNYIPIAVIILVLVWILVIHGVFDWRAGLLMSVIVVAVLWLGYLLLDSTIRDNISSVATSARDSVVDTLSTKNENIIGNLIKGYYTAVNHMILPEAAICGSSPTGFASFGPCGCFDTGRKISPVPGFTVTLKTPLPSLIINNQIETGGDLRCVGIDNQQTLLPIIDKAVPCIKNVDGFTLSKLSSKEKEKLADCALDSLPKSLTQCPANTKNTIEEKIECLVMSCNDKIEAPGAPALCSLIKQILECTTAGSI